MIRSPSCRIKSLADLNEASEPEFLSNDGNKKKISKAGQTSASDTDRASRLPASGAHPSSAQLPSLLQGFRCPVALGKPAVPTPHATRPCFTLQEDVDLMGHNGCILDGDKPESIESYLGRASALVDSPFQVAPHLEVGRLVEAAHKCRDWAKQYRTHRDFFNEQDKRGHSAMVTRTLAAMVRESVELGASLPGLTPLGREGAARHSLKPFAEKLVYDRTRESQADRRYRTWQGFATQIIDFCHGFVAVNYPEVLAPENLKIDAKLAAEHPEAAYQKAATAALVSKAWELRNQALR